MTNITDYGAFVELEPGVEGLIHVSEMSWTKKNMHPGKIVSTSQQVEVQVLEVDHQKRRISLGLKQCQENPWSEFAGAHAAGAEVEGEIRNITEFGLFIGLDGGVDGMVHLSDLDWNRPGEEAIKDFKKGDTVKRPSCSRPIPLPRNVSALGIKQLSDDPDDGRSGDLKKGAPASRARSLTVQENGMEVKLIDQRPQDRFHPPLRPFARAFRAAHGPLCCR